MASIGHVVIGLAVARAHQRHTEPDSGARRWGRAAVFAGLALAPDLDVVAFAFKIPYAHAFGHRGASHSLLAAAVVGAVCGVLLARAWKTPPTSTVLAAVAALASHPLLDMLTDGGLGCALWWPFSVERLFFPVTPIPVAPIGAAFVSARGLWCMAVELVLLSPVIVWLVASVWRERRRRALATAGAPNATARS